MWQFSLDLLGSAYAEVVILFLLLAYIFAHRKNRHYLVSGISLVRIILMVLIFLYLLMSWSSGIRPVLAATNVLGMFLINLYLLHTVILSRLERPYRDDLESYCQEPQNQDLLDWIWRRGKHFYYFRYFLNSFFSGVFPLRYLHEMATDRIRDDIQGTLNRCGYGQQFISLRGIADYVQTRVQQDGGLPAEFKEMIAAEMNRICQHPWIEEQVNEYLKTAIETPENIHNPEWSRMWEKARKST
jgi:Ca2+/Na+ antiporter